MASARRRVGAAFVVILIGIGMMAIAPAAIAHHPEIWADCELEDETYLISGTVGSWNGTTEASKTNDSVEVRRGGFNGTVVGSGSLNAGNGFSFSWSDALPDTTEGPVLYVAVALVRWGNGVSPRGESNLHPAQSMFLDFEGCAVTETTTTTTEATTTTTEATTTTTEATTTTTEANTTTTEETTTTQASTTTEATTTTTDVGPTTTQVLGTVVTTTKVTSETLPQTGLAGTGGLSVVGLLLMGGGLMLLATGRRRNRQPTVGSPWE